MAVLSPDRIKQLWIDAGGNPQQADNAAALAMAVSGGNPDYQKVNDDGTVDRGLWGINSTYGKQASVDPLQNARAAVAVSSNGSDWDPWLLQKWILDKIPWLGEKIAKTSPASPTSAFAELLGIDNLPKFTWNVLMLIGGAAWMIIGLILLVLGSRRFKAVGTFAAETIGGGVGFGVGARLSGGLEDKLFGGGDSPVPPTGPGAPAPPTGPAPQLPGGPRPRPRPALPAAPTQELPKVIQQSTGASARRRSYRVKVRQTVASGGTTHRPTSGAGPFPRRSQYRPITGEFPGGLKPRPGRHRAED